MAHRKEELGKGGEAPYNHSYRQIATMVRLAPQEEGAASRRAVRQQIVFATLG
ncbi:hypothetical protein O4G98_02485 [Zoogloeaceae bacterium G21618-S1]|uniref:hypothetical protein n=1 Tax=Denitromonas halophila TaxID=1629404 RepID=UPI00164290F6|nr:hypothetical protein [Denitromonas halophila]MCZ4303591.1 hypothetical protein [Zoogloeaceae bacterium G21618-S1]